MMIQDLVAKLNSLNRNSNEYGVVLKRVKDIRDYLDKNLKGK